MKRPVALPARPKWHSAFALAALMMAAACQSGSGENVPGDSDDDRPYDGIAEDATLRLTGTEPFWGASIEGGELTWSTLENIDGSTIAVQRFAGRGGLSFSGELDGQTMDVAVTPGECSDGMSDRTYPFHATVAVGSRQYDGCAWREGVDDPDAGAPAP